jgi:hypothetical protein
MVKNGELGLLSFREACTAPFYDVVVQHESVWGWDYLAGLCQTLGFSGPVACGTFPAGAAAE